MDGRQLPAEVEFDKQVQVPAEEPELAPGEIPRLVLVGVLAAAWDWKGDCLARESQAGQGLAAPENYLSLGEKYRRLRRSASHG